jgi:hypothetical protein
VSRYTIHVVDEGTGELRGEVLELPGCTASGRDEAELHRALRAAIGEHRERRERPSRR